MIKLVALDLDGTTLQKGSVLSEHTREILEETLSRGIHMVAASGRSFYSFPEAIKRVKGLRYAISSNGSSLYDLETERCILHNMLKPDRVEAVMEIIDSRKEERIAIECFVDGRSYAEKALVDAPWEYGILSDSGAAYIRNTRQPLEDIRGFIHEHRHELDAFDFLIPQSDIKEEVQRELAKIPGVYVTSSQTYMVEVADEKAGKGAAVRWLAEQLQIKPEEIMACGNAENDMDMMSFAGLGVAVANSEEKVKAIADYVTEDNNHEGVANAIEKFVLSEN